MERYLLFTFDEFTPLGGAADYFGSYETIEEAESAFQRSRDERGNVLDIQTEEVTSLKR